jgi:hypothetical protein
MPCRSGELQPVRSLIVGSISLIPDSRNRWFTASSLNTTDLRGWEESVGCQALVVVGGSRWAGRPARGRSPGGLVGSAAASSDGRRA